MCILGRITTFRMSVLYSLNLARYLKKIILIYPFRLLVDRCGETPCHFQKLVEMILFIVGHISKDDIFQNIFHPDDTGPHQSDTIKQLYYYSNYLISSKEDIKPFLTSVTNNFTTTLII